MSDLAQWKLSGPVRTARIEFAEWDSARQEWPAPRNYTLLSFRPDGNTSDSEAHNPDGSITRVHYSYEESGRLRETRFQTGDGPISKLVYSYDEAGRPLRVVHAEPDGSERESEVNSYASDGTRTRMCFTPKLPPDVPFGFAIEGTEQSISVAGAQTAATAYGRDGLPGEVLFHDAEHRLLRTLLLLRDSAGRLVRVEMKAGEEMPLPGVQAELNQMPAKAREAMAGLLAKLYGPENVTTYQYDDQGRMTERRMQIGEIGDNLTTYRYDDRGNPSEQDIEDTSREMEIDDQGRLQPLHERSHRQNVRFEYRWDERGNWTERTVWMRTGPDRDFERSNIERREITYYPG
jgi:YD repeat-containing protein